jgi:lipid-A-disaccharide synthase
MKYYIIAGEASGDLHASNLMRELHTMDANAEIRCWGGDLMQAQGGNVVKHYRDLAFMGFVEVLMNIRTIARNLRFCKKDILEYQPDVLLLVDYPGFNLRIAEFAKQHNIKVVYYISPQIWAWKQNRIKKIKRDIDEMMVILPFEESFYQKHNYPVHYVGHPLLDAVNDDQLEISEAFRAENNLDDRPIIALLPGSRKQEISKMLPLMSKMAIQYPNYQFVIAATKHHSKEYYQSFMGGADIPLLIGQTYPLFKHAHAALVTSGTATLEAALFNVPEVVCYVTSTISYQIAKRLVKISYISLPNLVMDKRIVTELIQSDFNEQQLKQEFEAIVGGESRELMLTEYSQMKQKLGAGGASRKAAKVVYNCAQS